MTDWIGAAEAAQRLGIKQATLYAYVSRGVLGRRREADGRAACSMPTRSTNWPAGGGRGARAEAAWPGPSSSPR